MGVTNSYPAVSDGIAALIKQFEKGRSGGIVIVKRDMGDLLDGLQALHDAARHVETIADRAQWNEAARRQGVKADRATLEAGIADGSVAVFPVVPRPVPAQRTKPEGGAA